jgi:ABC-type bacteriocin/lantibiotic exporter with double-glycine peptidase domain
MAAIRHLSQLGNRLVNECGQTCVAMLANAYNDTALSIEDVARATGTDKGRFTPFYAYNILNADGTVKERVTGLYDMLNHYGIKAQHTGAATWEFYVSKLAEGVPVIALVAYRTYGDIGHFMVVTRIHDGKVTVFDPLAANGPTEWTEADFRRAITTRSKYTGGTNNITQAMYPLAPLSAPVPTMFDRISTVAAEIHIAADVLRKAG